MSESNIGRILDYLRQHSGAYGQAELREQLLAAGYSVADVDAAFARFAAEAAAPDQPPASAPAPDPEAEQLRRAIDYLKRHRGDYEDRSLRDTLIRSGYPAATVDAAMSSLFTPAVASTERRPRAWPFGMLLALFNIGLLAIVAFVEASIANDLVITGWLGLALLAGELIAGLALRISSRERLGRILILGPIFTVAAAALLVGLIILLVGICFAILSAF